MYLILANEILHALHPKIITIAEDVSDLIVCFLFDKCVAVNTN